MLSLLLSLLYLLILLLLLLLLLLLIMQVPYLGLIVRTKLSMSFSVVKTYAHISSEHNPNSQDETTYQIFYFSYN